jgi:hypothetical protein
MWSKSLFYVASLIDLQLAVFLQLASKSVASCLNMSMPCDESTWL